MSIEEGSPEAGSPEVSSPEVMSAEAAPADSAAAEAEAARTVPSMGDPRVDAAMQRLSDVEGAPLDEQPAIYEDVLSRLKGALDDSAR